MDTLAEFPLKILNIFCKTIFFFLHMFLSNWTVSRDFRPLFFCLKDSTWALYEQAKAVSRILSFSRRLSIAKFVNRVSSNDRKPCRLSGIPDFGYSQQ